MYQMMKTKFYILCHLILLRNSYYKLKPSDARLLIDWILEPKVESLYSFNSIGCDERLILADEDISCIPEFCNIHIVSELIVNIGYMYNKLVAYGIQQTFLNDSTLFQRTKK